MIILLEASVSALQAQGTIAKSSYFDMCSGTSEVSMPFTSIVDVDVERRQRWQTLVLLIFHARYPTERDIQALRSALFHSGRRFNVYLITIAAITFSNTNIESFFKQSPKRYQSSWLSSLSWWVPRGVLVSVAIGRWEAPTTAVQASPYLTSFSVVMEDIRQGIKSKRLTKEPPPRDYHSPSMNQSNATVLQRQPSSSQSPASNHDRTPSHHTSSSSSLERSTNPSSQYAASSSNDPYNNRHQYPSHQSLDEREPDEFNAHPGTLSALDSTKASGYQNSLRRPAPPPLSYTTPNAKMMTPSLRQSASFSMGDRSGNAAPPDAETSSVSSKRYSDDANGKNSTPWKKKSGFSNFIGSVLGSPRSNSVKISAPENPVHVTHVGFDNETGQFTVCSDISLRQIPSKPAHSRKSFATACKDIF